MDEPVIVVAEQYCRRNENVNAGHNDVIKAQVYLLW